MKAVLVLIASLMIMLGLTGVFWPEGLIELAKYSFTSTGIYVTAIARVVIGVLLFVCARAASTPKTIRFIGLVILIAGVATFFITGARAEAVRDWLTGHGPDTIRIAACLPLAIGFLIGGATIFNRRRV